MPILENVISQALTPALTVSGIGLLASSMNNRLMTITGRTRDINQRLLNTSQAIQQENYRKQVRLFLKRAILLKYGLFLFYAAVGCMVFTAIAIALHEIIQTNVTIMIAPFSFLAGFIFVFAAVGIQAWELTLSLDTLYLDIKYSDMLQHQE